MHHAHTNGLHRMIRAPQQQQGGGTQTYLTVLDRSLTVVYAGSLTPSLSLSYLPSPPSLLPR